MHTVTCAIKGPFNYYGLGFTELQMFFIMIKLFNNDLITAWTIFIIYSIKMQPETCAICLQTIKYQNNSHRTY